jgi:glycosyltransferase involved in cell wall biosynthesis
MKKIVFVIYSMEYAGGSERVTANIANKLSQYPNYEIHIISLFNKKSYFELQEKVAFEALSIERTSYFSVGKKLIKRINDLCPDVIVGISIQKLNIFLALCSIFFKKNIKMIASEHISYGSVGKLHNYIKRVLYRKFSTIAVLTLHDQEAMEKARFKNVMLLRNASTFFPDLNSLSTYHKREKVIMAVGRLEFQKGFDLLINCWAMIYRKFPEWKLYIVGEGSLKEELDELVEQKIENVDACQIHPFSDHLQDYFENAQLFVLSSRFEGLPMVMIEAICFGIPCVAFDCETGPREIINKHNGRLIENGNLVRMVEELELLLEDQKLRETLSNACLNDRVNYKLDTIIKQWQQILD